MDIRLILILQFFADLKSAVSELDNTFLLTHEALAKQVDTLDQLGWLKVVSDLIVDYDGLVELNE